MYDKATGNGLDGLTNWVGWDPREHQGRAVVVRMMETQIWYLAVISVGGGS